MIDEDGGQGACAKRAKTREVRLGLVMYGGVSLAIYINGIAHELFRAVRGRGVYRLLKALTDSDVVVDVMSGSSAGGINGVLLGYALCNEKEFAPAASLWRARGDIGQLLRDTDEPASAYQSLFDSEHKYEPWLREAFDDLSKAHISDEVRKKEDSSRVDELDLFITGTDYYGRKWMTQDDRGAEIDVKDHRAIFRLKHRTRRSRLDGPAIDPKLARLPFSPEAGPGDRMCNGPSFTHAALARLCRITSCFPAAFAPVTVGTVEPWDLRLRYWGSLPDRGERIYIDGGVLDNKPFSMTLAAIYSRLSMRPVKRWLLYVEPHPEEFQADIEDLEPPNVAETIVASVAALPGYESIADDLRSLRAHNDRVRRTRALTTVARRALLERLAKESERQGRGDLVAPSEPEDTATTDAYRTLRLQGLAEQLFASLFSRELERSSEDQRTRAAQKSLRAWFDEHVLADDSKLGRRAPRQEAFDRYARLDVEFRLRRLFHLVYAELMPDVGEGGGPSLSPDLLDAINRQIELLEIIRSAMELAVVEVASSWFTVGSKEVFDAVWAARAWAQVRDALSRVLALPPPQSYERMPESRVQGVGVTEDQLASVLHPEELGSFYEALVERARSLVKSGPKAGPNDVGASRAGDEDVPAPLLEACDQFELRLLGHSKPHLKRYLQFEQVDRIVYPVEAVADMRSQDVIELARISPVDSRVGLADRSMDEKVIGHRFGHFAAFFKRSWRSNDIFWGRIDGACKLIDVLLDTARLTELFGVGAKRDSVARDALRELVSELKEDPSALRLPKRDRTRLLAWLDALIEATTSEAAIAELVRTEGKDGPRRWLIEAAQLEAAFDDLHTVYGDAALDQLGWNQYQEAPNEPFVPGESHLDPGLVAAAVEQLGHAAVEKAKQSPEQLRKFVDSKLRVARETTRDIPPLVLLDWIARGLIVAQKALLESLGERRDAVRSNPFYQIILGWPLRLFAGVVTALRRSPVFTTAATLGALGYILLSIVVVLNWPEAIWKDGKLDQLGAILFLGVPVFCAMLVRFIVAGTDGSGLLVWVLRVAGWLMAFFLVLVAVPVLGHVASMNDALACTGEPISRLPDWLKGLYTNWCLPRSGSIAIIGRWVVLVVVGFGIIAVSGAFGWLTRRVRAAMRRMTQNMSPKLTEWRERRLREGRKR